MAYYIPEPITEGTWNVLLIAVDPQAHGKGIGQGLMRYIEAQLVEEGVRVLLVETSGTPEFERTRHFYDQLGYDREARIRDYYAADDDKVIFRKRCKCSGPGRDAPARPRSGCVLDLD